MKYIITLVALISFSTPSVASYVNWDCETPGVFRNLKSDCARSESKTEIKTLKRGGEIDRPTKQPEVLPPTTETPVISEGKPSRPGTSEVASPQAPSEPTKPGNQSPSPGNPNTQPDDNNAGGNNNTPPSNGDTSGTGGNNDTPPSNGGTPDTDIDPSPGGNPCGGNCGIGVGNGGGNGTGNEGNGKGPKK